MCNLYENINTLCNEHNVTPGGLCSKLGFRRSVLSDLKSGRKKSLDTTTLVKIAAYFDVSVDFLLGTEKEKSPTPEDEREIDDETLKAAFWGGEKDLPPEELDALWEDVREYARYKAELRRKKKHE